MVIFRRFGTLGVLMLMLAAALAAGCSSGGSESDGSRPPASAGTSADETPDPPTGKESLESGAPEPSETTAAAPAPGRYVDYSADVIAATPGTKLLFFHAPWCSQCKRLEDDIKASGVPDGVTIFKVDYDSNKDLRRKHGVTIQTTVVKVDDRGATIDRHVPYDAPQLRSVTDALLN